MIDCKKIVFTSPWKVELLNDKIDDINIPAGHILLKKTYSLISTGTELACLSGKEDWFSLPGVPGYCCVGNIIKIGAGVEGFEIGDRIFCYGNHCELEVKKVEGIFIKVPEDIEEMYVPFVRMATIAATAIRVSDIEFGDYVAVAGQGLVGNMAAQLARLQGAVTIVIDFFDKRLSIAKKCGADYAINPEIYDIKAEISNITGSKMVSTVIEATGNPASAASNLEIIARNGEIIFLGSPRGKYTSDLTLVLNKCHLAHSNITFKGAHEWKYPINNDNFTKHSIERNTLIMFEMIKNDRLCVEWLVSEVAMPDDCQAAYDKLRNFKGDYMGIIFDWTK